jgi:hypothetical protein
MSPVFFPEKRLQRVLAAGVPPLKLPEKVNEQFAASCHRCPRLEGQGNGKLEVLSH